MMECWNIEDGGWKKYFKQFKSFKSFKPPPRIKSGAGSLFLPRVAGEDKKGGLNEA